MAKKKFQVFISSTYTDLIKERQAAGHAILKAGHIPVGMEFFIAGKPTDEIIEKSIKESDIYMLLIGKRYGSLKEETGISYTHWEFRYALELKKPWFALLLEEEGGTKKEISRNNRSEIEDYMSLCDFVEEVEKTGNLYARWDDIKDIKSGIKDSLREIEDEKKEKLSGWVRSDEMDKRIKKTEKDLLALSNFISRVTEEPQNDFDCTKFNRICELLTASTIESEGLKDTLKPIAEKFGGTPPNYLHYLWHARGKLFEGFYFNLNEADEADKEYQEEDDYESLMEEQIILEELKCLTLVVEDTATNGFELTVPNGQNFYVRMLVNFRDKR